MIAFLNAGLAFAKMGVGLIAQHWRLAAAGAGGLMLAVLLLVLRHEHREVLDARSQRDRAVAQAASAAAQASLNQSAVAAVGKADASAAAVTVKGQEAVHEILTAPGADARLPDAVRTRWLAGLDSLRQPAAAQSAAADHPGG